MHAFGWDAIGLCPRPPRRRGELCVKPASEVEENTRGERGVRLVKGGVNLSAVAIAPDSVG